MRISLSLETRLSRKHTSTGKGMSASAVRTADIDSKIDIPFDFSDPALAVLIGFNYIASPD